MELIYGGGAFVVGKAGAGADLIYDGGKFSILAASITAAVSRVVAESVNTYLEAGVTRSTAEAVYGIDYVTVSRQVLEAISEPTLLNGITTRMLVEVLGEDTFVVPVPQAEVTRAVLEVLGLEASTLGKKADVTRSVAEALVSLQTRSKGLQMPSVSLDAVSVYMAVTLNVAEGPGYLGFRDQNGDGFSLTWPGGGSTVTKTWTHGASSTSSTFSYPGGIAIVDLRAPATGTPALMTDFGTLKPDGNQASGQVHELLLFNQSVDNGKDTEYRAYLTCKWVTPGCTSPLTPCQS